MTMFFKQFFAKRKRSLGVFAITAAINLPATIATALPARSADTIFLDYGFLGRSIPVASLERYAQEGYVDDSLAPYLCDLSPEEKQTLERVLNTRLSDLSSDVPEVLSDPFMLSQWLYSPIGDISLTALGLFVQTRGRQNGHQAIRAAAVLAVASPEGLSLMNVIRFYPTEGIRLDFSQILAFVKALENNIETTEQLISEISQQSEAISATEPSLDYEALSVLADTPQVRVEVRSLTLNDRERDRTYPVDLYLPNDVHTISGSLPVMVFSHGYGDTRTHPDTVAAAHSIAANGFAVAVPEHVGSNQAFQTDFIKGFSHESFEVMEFINRPKDIHFLLDTLEQQNDGDFQGRLQLDRVGITGHSFGGYTALALAGATINLDLLKEQCDPEARFTPDTVNISLLIQCRVLELAESPSVLQQFTDGSLADERVGFVFALAPMSNLFSNQSISEIQIPIAIAGGSYDVATPVVQEQLAIFQKLTTDSKYFYLVENLSHTPELTRTILDLVHPDSDLSEGFKATEDWLFDVVVTVLIAHAKTHLLEDDAYLPYLTSAYVESVSVEPTKVHLIRAMD